MALTSALLQEGVKPFLLTGQKKSRLKNTSQSGAIIEYALQSGHFNKFGLTTKGEKLCEKENNFTNCSPPIINRISTDELELYFTIY